MLHSDSIHWGQATISLTSTELALVQRSLYPRSFSPNDSLFSQGAPATEAFILLNGRIRLSMYNRSGKLFTTGIWSQGYVIGLISSYLGEPRFITATAIDSLDVHALPRDRLLACMRTIPQFAINISLILAQQASDSIKRSGLLALDSISMRLCRVLLRIATPLSSNPRTHDPAVITRISQQELADMVGASRVSVNHYLSSWAQANLIQTSPSRILIHSQSALSKVILKE